MIDYQNSLRESCFEAYAGVIHCCKSETPNNGNKHPAIGLPTSLRQHSHRVPFTQFVSDSAKALESQVPIIIEFIILAMGDPDFSDGVLSGAVGLIGDLAGFFGLNILQMLEQDAIQDILTKGRRSKSSKIRSVAGWATKELKRLKNAANNATNNPAVVASSW